MRHIMNRTNSVLSALALTLGVIMAAGEGADAAPRYIVIDLGDLGGGTEATAINNAGQVTGQSYCPGVCVHAFRYTFPGPMLDLGTLGAPGGGGGGSRGEAINASGQVTGYSSTADYRIHAFRYTDGEGLIDLGTLGGPFDSKGYAINASGQVTGEASNAPNLNQAFLYTDGVGMLDLGALGGFVTSVGLAINDAGQVVGSGCYTLNSFGACVAGGGFLYSNGVVTTFGSAAGYANAINNAGQVTGFSSDCPGGGFFYDQGSVQCLGTLPGGSQSAGWYINSAGQVAGIADTAAGDLHAFLWDPSTGAMKDLGTLGGTQSVPRAINNAGQVTGYSYTTGDVSTHAFLYSEGVLHDLNALTDYGQILVEGRAINDSGWITGGPAFLAIPVSGADTTRPDFTLLPTDQTVEATGATGAVVTYTVSAEDAVDGPRPVSCGPPSGSIFPLGTTTVNCSASDLSGNTANGSFTVTVVDTTPPALTVPADITVNATQPSGAVVSYSASAADLVDGSVPPACSWASGATFPIGTTTVTCTPTDSRGNTLSPPGTFTVTVEGAAAQLTDLINVVNNLGLPGGLTNNLVAKLQQARNAVNAGNIQSACGKLTDFIKLVNNNTPKNITPAQASQLIASAMRIQSVIGCK